MPTTTGLSPRLASSLQPLWITIAVLLIIVVITAIVGLWYWWISTHIGTTIIT